MTADLLSFIAGIVALILAGAAAVIQTVIARMPRVRAHGLAQDDGSTGRALVRIVEDPAPYMTAAVILMFSCDVAATVLATGIALRHFDSGAEIGAALVMTIVVGSLFDLAPRTYATVNLEKAALLFARPALLLGRLLTPVTRLFVMVANAAMSVLPGTGLRKGPFATYQEVRSSSEDEVDDEEGDEHADRELISSIFDFGDTVVREVMVPRPDMVCVPAQITLDQTLEVALRAGYSRIPIFEGDTDNIVGVMYVKDVLKRIREGGSGSMKVRALGRSPLFVPETKKVADLLREMQEQHVHMAIVVDEYGGTAGLVTIEDLIEEIVGEIVDEYDQEEPLVEPIDEDTIRVDAKMPIDEVNELLGIELPHEEWDTVGGLVFGLTGRVPVAGEKVGYDAVEFLTERVSGRRVQKVVIRKLDDPQQSAEG
jgi:CBS domain containing-hemolysin-like protein